MLRRKKESLPIESISSIASRPTSMREQKFSLLIPMQLFTIPFIREPMKKHYFGFSINGQGKDAFLLFKHMLGTQITPNSFTFASVIGSCVGQNGGLENCSMLHAHVLKRGFCAMNFVLCSLVDGYAKWE
ncbi:hypothetical protein PIB30_016410 [Stylosanthes scabra]|uniref:Uncharacterized protein n=1 Tax=Stylosanthes scabra TaxID=79078 RepID=A0ABU6V7K0_9FABA|nr:hypothetical protein [Stylosanthes scabra]